MRFEEVLPELKKGKYIRHLKHDKNAECWHSYGDDRYERLTIRRCDKYRKFLTGSEYYAIPRWALMSNDWEILEDKI